MTANTPSPTNKDSGSGEELKDILFDLAADAILNSTLATGDTGVDKALAAISAYTQRQVLQGRISEIELLISTYIHWGWSTTHLKDRLATLQQELDGIRGEGNT